MSYPQARAETEYSTCGDVSGTWLTYYMAQSPLDIPEDLLAALDSAVSGIAAIRQQIHSLQAAEALCLAAASEIANSIARAGAHPDHGEMAHRMVAADIGAATHESDRSTAARMGRAWTLTNEYPTVFASLAAGKISAAHATTINDAGCIITDVQQRRLYAAEALEYAEAESVGRLRPVAKELAERFAERSLDERHESARACRMVRVVEREDGMADLIATLPALYAYGIKDRLDQAAHLIKSEGSANRDSVTTGAVTSRGNVEAGVSDARKIDEIRADLLTDLLLTSDLSKLARMRTTGIGAIHARVQVVVPGNRLAIGHEASEPLQSTASLAGYGPIDTESARLIAASTPTWQRVQVAPATGSVLSVDGYRPNAELRKYLGARDQHCRFPGCRTPLRKCDIDHTIDAAQGGPTSSANLAHLCRKHHTMKHATPWRVTQDEAGVLRWISPTGRMHSDRPSSRVRFRSVPGLGARDDEEIASSFVKTG